MMKLVDFAGSNPAAPCERGGSTPPPGTLALYANRQSDVVENSVCAASRTARATFNVE